MLVLKGRAADDTARRELLDGEPIRRKGGEEAVREAAEAAGTGRSASSTAGSGIEGGGMGVMTSSTGSRLAGLAAVRLDGLAKGVEALLAGIGLCGVA